SESGILSKVDSCSPLPLLARGALSFLLSTSIWVAAACPPDNQVGLKPPAAVHEPLGLAVHKSVVKHMGTITMHTTSRVARILLESGLLFDIWHFSPSLWLCLFACVCVSVGDSIYTFSPRPDMLTASLMAINPNACWPLPWYTVKLVPLGAGRGVRALDPAKPADRLEVIRPRD
ncbi:unnamed protein product, partial [Protopolystoma xenopodis]